MTFEARPLPDARGRVFERGRSPLSLTFPSPARVVIARAKPEAISIYVLSLS